MKTKDIDVTEYRQLAELRAGLRSYLAWAEGEAKNHELTPQQVQLMLAIRAHDCPTGPTMGELAESLFLRHNSVVGLVDRAERAELVRRERDAEHASRVHVVLTDDGSSRLDSLSRLHLDWLAANGDELATALRSFA